MGTKEPEYEAEVRKQYEKLNYRISYGWEHNNPGKDYFLMNDLWWKVLGIFAIFVPIYMNYMPDCLGKTRLGTNEKLSSESKKLSKKADQSSIQTFVHLI